MYHMHRPLKNQRWVFFSLWDTCSIFLKWSSYLCTHSSRLLGQCLAHPGCAVVGNTLSRFPSPESLHFLFFPWNMCVPVTSHPNLLILQDSNTTPSRKPLPTPPGSLMFCFLYSYGAQDMPPPCQVPALCCDHDCFPGDKEFLQ